MASGQTDKWQSKALALARELDELEARWESTEKRLLQILKHISIACQGRDQNLDRQLQRFGVVLQEGRTSEDRLQHLETIADSLLHCRPPSPAPEHWQIQCLDSLLACSLPRRERSVLEKLRDRIGQQSPLESQHFYRSLQAVFSAAVDEKAKSGLLGRWLGTASEHGPADTKLLKRYLVQLLDEMTIPPALKSQSERLLNQLQQESCDLEAVLHGTTSLLADINAFLKKEQHEIEAFLSQLTEKLQTLERHARDVGRVLAPDTAWSDVMSQQVEHLRHHTLAETDLETLKSTVSQRLDTLTEQLRSYQAAEAQKSKDVDHQVQVLTQRLQALEKESEELHQRLRMAHQQALYDPVTGLPNRKAVEERFAQEFSRWKRFGQPLSLLIWDIDRFKAINDRFGHQAGDKALRIVAQVLAKGIREADFVGRYGGEEFVMLLPGTPVEGGLKVAEKLREAVKHCGFNSRGKPVPITISCGVTELREGDSLNKAFERADQALYQAKMAGRDCCRSA